MTTRGERSEPILVHIGFHKTASTWLQKHLFNVEAGAGFACPWTVNDIAGLLVDPHPFAFDPEAAGQRFAPGMTEARSRGRIPVISCEELSGNPQSGGWSNLMVAERLHAMFPQARILIVIREQRAMIRSTYKQYVRMGGAATIRHYLDPPEIGPRVPGFRFDNFQYHHLVNRYRDMFGADRVLVTPMERLSEDPEAFTGEIAGFAGGEHPGEPPRQVEYASHRTSTVAIQRHLNRLFGRTTVNPGAPFHTWRLKRWYERLDRITPAAIARPFERRLDTAVRIAAKGRYADSNAALGKTTGLDLARFGYELPADPADSEGDRP